MARAALFAVAALAVCRAQDPQHPLGTVEGQITSSLTGEPLKNVAVRLMALEPSISAPGVGLPLPPDDAYTLVTGASGRFAFDSLPPGGYSISATRTGYIANRVTLTVDASPSPELVPLQLTPYGRIEGRVTDEDGEPYRARISIQSAGSTQGMDSGDSAADGTFVLEVAPGRYYLQAMPKPFNGGFGQSDMTGAWPREARVATYWPDSTAISGATKIKVDAGAIVRGLEIRMRRVTVYTVRGHAIDVSTGQPAANVTIALDAGTIEFPWQEILATTLADGSFEFSDVQPGTYSAGTAMNRPPNGLAPAHPLYSFQPVVVAKENVENLEISLQRGAEVQGKITLESGEPAKPTGSWRVTVAHRSYGIRNDGGFSISDLAPGKYALQLFTQPAQTYVKSVRLNQQEMADMELDLSSGAGGTVEVVLSSHVAEVSGTVRDASGAPMAQARVTLWRPAPSGKASPTTPPVQTRTDANGAFRLGSLAPGEYRLAALAEPPEGALITPELLRVFDSRAAVVKLEEDGRASVDPPFIPQADIEQAEEAAE